MARPGLHPVAGAWAASLRDQIVSTKIKAAALEAVELKNAACFCRVDAFWNACTKSQVYVASAAADDSDLNNNDDAVTFRSSWGPEKRNGEQASVRAEKESVLDLFIAFPHAV